MKAVRWLRIAVALGLLAVVPGCVWLQNETFVFDVAPPVAEAPPGTDAAP